MTCRSPRHARLRFRFRACHPSFRYTVSHPPLAVPSSPQPLPFFIFVLGVRMIEFSEFEKFGNAALAADTGSGLPPADFVEAFRQSPLPMFISDFSSLAILAVNDSAIRYYGFSREEFASMTMLDLRYFDDVPKLLASSTSPDSDSRESSLSRRHRKKDGAVIDVSTSAASIQWAGKRALLILVRDVTDQNRAQAALRKSDQRFRAAFAQAAVGFIITDLEGRYVSANLSFSRIVGYSPDELCSMSFQQITHPGELPADLAFRQRILQGEISSFILEKRYIAKSGEFVWVQNSVAAIHDSAGVLAGFVTLSEDISQRKRMETVLRESEDRYRDLVEHSTDLICTHDLQGRLLSVNELPAKLLGYSTAELLGRSMRDFLFPELRGGFDQYLVDIQRDGFAKGVISVFAKSGERRIWEYHNTLRTEGVSEPIVRGVAHDITEQKRVENQLRISEEKFAKAFRCSSNLICISTVREGRFLDVNESFERLSGYSRSELIGHTVNEFDLWLDPAQRVALVDSVQRVGHARDQEVQFRVKSGKIVIVLLSVELIELRGENCLLTVGQGITERKRAEEERTRLASIVERSSEFVGICDLQLRPLFLNDAGRRLIGIPASAPLRHAIVSDLFFPEDQSFVVNQILPAVLDNGSWAGEFRFRHLKTLLPINVLLEVFRIDDPGSGRPMNIATVSRDMTERIRSEEKLRQYEKAVEGSREMIAVIDRDYRYLLANRAFLDFRGMTRDQVEGHVVREVLNDGVFDRIVRAKLDECFRGNVVRYELKSTYPVIGERDLELAYFPVSGSNGIDRVACIIRDVTERKRAELELRRLSGQLLQLQDNERRRIARELHDSTGQNLTALAAMLDQLRASIPPSSRKSRKLLSQCQSLANLSMCEIRTLSYVLHPPMLDQSGVEDAVRHYLDGFEKRSGIRVDLEVSPTFGRLSRDIELALFRVVQESLTNIHRHSGGRRAKIRLDRNACEVFLAVSDDGHGASGGKLPAPAASSQWDAGVGIPSMHQRVKLIGGQLAILSNSGGTTVRVTLPAGDHTHE